MQLSATKYSYFFWSGPRVKKVWEQLDLGMEQLDLGMEQLD